jgi:hypothetical protein
MRFREQSTIGWLMAPILGVTVLGHNVKQNPELLRQRRRFMSEAIDMGDFVERLAIAAGGKPIGEP